MFFADKNRIVLSDSVVSDEQISFKNQTPVRALFLFLNLLERAGELIRAGRAPAAAVYPAEQSYNFIRVHAFDQL